jgi:hypothetical protein
MPKSPLALVKERFKDKAGLVAAVKALATDELWNAQRLNSAKGLDHVSNKKLLHLHDVLSSVKNDHGSRAKLIEAIATQHKRSKDKGFQGRLESRSTPELFQLLNVANKRTKAASAPKAARPAKPAKAAKAAKAPKAKAATKTKTKKAGKAKR